MLKQIAFGLGACVVFLFSTSALALDLNPGKYSITSTVQMPGMPAGAIPPQTISQCITEQDPIPRNDASNQDCKIKNMKETNNTVTWEMECLQQGTKITSQGRMTYAGDSFEGNITMNMGAQAGNMTIITTITGVRLGDCTGSQ